VFYAQSYVQRLVCQELLQQASDIESPLTTDTWSSYC